MTRETRFYILDALSWPQPRPFDDWTIPHELIHVAQHWPQPGVRVSTIFLGVDIGPGPPAPPEGLFETMVFWPGEGERRDGPWRAATRAKALALHGGIVVQLLEEGVTDNDYGWHVATVVSTAQGHVGLEAPALPAGFGSGAACLGTAVVGERWLLEWRAAPPFMLGEIREALRVSARNWTYAIGHRGPLTGIWCANCRRVSFHAVDVAERYCGACHAWHVRDGETAE